MNREEFKKYIITKTRPRDAFDNEVIQSFTIEVRSIVRDEYRPDYTRVLEYTKREGEHVIANMLYGDVKQKLRKFRSSYARNPVGFRYDLIDEINEIIDSMPD